MPAMFSGCCSGEEGGQRRSFFSSARSAKAQEYSLEMRQLKEVLDAHDSEKLTLDEAKVQATCILERANSLVQQAHASDPLVTNPDRALSAVDIGLSQLERQKLASRYGELDRRHGAESQSCLFRGQKSSSPLSWFGGLDSCLGSNRTTAAAAPAPPPLAAVPPKVHWEDQQTTVQTRPVLRPVLPGEGPPGAPEVDRREFNMAKKAVMEQKDALGISLLTQLKFYGLGCQAIKGDCNMEAPSVFSVVARQKWGAWEAARGKSKEDATHEFMELAKSQGVKWDA